jgi:hypothetical protein
MIFLMFFGDHRLAITVQPTRQPVAQPSSPPADETSVLLFGHSLGKALSQMFGAHA